MNKTVIQNSMIVMIISFFLVACGNSSSGRTGNSNIPNPSSNPTLQDPKTDPAIEPEPTLSDAESLDDASDEAADTKLPKKIVAPVLFVGSDIDITVSRPAETPTDTDWQTPPAENTPPAQNDDTPPPMVIEQTVVARTPTPIIAMVVPDVSLVFDGGGKIKSVTIGYNDKEFKSADKETYISKTDLFGEIAGADENVASYIYASRKAAFNFTSNYMVYVGWGMKQKLSPDSNEETIRISNGNLVAGFETTGANIFADSGGGTIGFAGKGSGLYVNNNTSDLDGGYYTKFDVTANVNFTATTIELKTTNTSCSDADCGNINASYLNFESTLSYEKDDAGFPINVITGDIDTKQSGTEGMIGTINARFYGPDVEEFGGTFSADGVEADGTYHYFGAFGAKRGVAFLNAEGYVAEGADPFLPIFPYFSHDNTESVIDFDSFQHALDKADTINKNLIVTSYNAMVVERTERNYYINQNDEWVSQGKITTLLQTTAPAIKIAFNKRGYMDAAGVYFDAENQKTYRTARYTSKTWYDGGTDKMTRSKRVNVPRGIEEASSDIYSEIEVYRGVYFGWTKGKNSKYMAAVKWELSKSWLADNALADNKYVVDGIAFGGFQTTDAELLQKTGTVRLTGTGYGYYTEYGVGNSELHATTQLDVNFDKKEVDLKHINTQCYDSGKSYCGYQGGYALNFGAIFTYDDKNEMLAHTRTANGLLSGTVQARFFGPAAQEFGGTFAFQNDDASITYHGMFGAIK